MPAMAHRPASAEAEVCPVQPETSPNRLQDGLGNSAMAEIMAPARVTSEVSVLSELMGGGPAEDVAPPTTVPSGKLGDVYRDHQAAIPGMDLRPTSEHQWAINHFKETYGENMDRYAAVAEQTGVPPELIAALHYRESSMKFGTYLHQGDPLGRKAVNHPNNIPIFDEWEEAAVHALNQKSGVRDALNMNEHTTDPAALATYAERYNGLGYHNRGKESPYVYSGTDVYEGGKYVRDGVYDPKVWDRQPGVMALIASLQSEDGEMPEWANPQSPEEAWGSVAEGNVMVRHGQRGPVIEALQGRLASAGFELAADGDFGNKTKEALIAFQKANGLDPDGVVGPATAAALEAFGPVDETAECSAEEGALEEDDIATEEMPREEVPAAEEAEPDTWALAIRGGSMLRRGGKGDRVSELQNRLVAAGHDVGSVDGDFGPRTRAAVMALQRAAGLKPDGIVGPATVALLGR